MKAAAIVMSGDSEMPALQDWVVCNQSLPATEVDGEVVLMDMGAGKYFSLDPVGTDVWRRMADPVRVDELCTALAADYAAPAETVRADVLALLERLIERDLVRIENPPGGPSAE